MYITTPEIRARTIDGWDHLTTGSKVHVDMKLDPSTLTKNGQGTIRRWLKKGYCERLSGHLPAYWQSLMYVMNARFVMKDDGTMSFIRIFDPGIMAKVKDPQGEFAATFKLLRAAYPSHNGESLLAMNVHDDVDHQQTVYAMTGRKWAGNVQFYGQEYHRLRTHFINQFGPPTEEADHGLETFKQVHTLRVSVTQEEHLTNKGTRYSRDTYCKIGPI